MKGQLKFPSVKFPTNCFYDIASSCEKSRELAFFYPTGLLVPQLEAEERIVTRMEPSSERLEYYARGIRLAEFRYEAEDVRRQKLLYLETCKAIAALATQHQLQVAVDFYGFWLYLGREESSPKVFLGSGTPPASLLEISKDYPWTTPHIQKLLDEAVTTESSVEIESLGSAS